MLINHLYHWIECENVHAIHVVYHDPMKTPSKDLQYISDHYNVKLLQQTSNKLSNRYNIPRDGFETEAIFTVDDDFVIDCKLVNKAFDYWVNNTRSPLRSIVGFEPRMIDFSEYSSLIPYNWNYACEHCNYNTIFITKGAFLHRVYYEKYFHAKYDSVRAMVDHFITGEDLLMSYVFHDQNFNYEYEIIAVQAVNFTHKIHTKKFRPFISNYNLFSVLEHINTASGLDSLSLRSSWNRKLIIESIYKLSKTGVLPIKNNWVFVSNTNVTVQNIKKEECAKYKENLKCKAEFHIEVLNLQFCLQLAITWSIVFYVIFCLISKTRKGFTLIKLKN